MGKSNRSVYSMSNVSYPSLVFFFVLPIGIGAAPRSRSNGVGFWNQSERIPLRWASSYVGLASTWIIGSGQVVPLLHASAIGASDARAGIRRLLLRDARRTALVSDGLHSEWTDLDTSARTGTNDDYAR